MNDRKHETRFVELTLTDPLTLYFHVRMLLGMVVGFGLTHLLRGLADIIEQPRAKPVYWVHLVWAVFVFVYLLHFWWWELRFVQAPRWTFLIFTFIVIFALMLYVLSDLVFPRTMSRYRNYRDYFYSRRRWFFGILGATFFIDLYDTWLKSGDYFHSLGVEYLIRNFSFVGLCIVAIVSRNSTFHGAFASAALLYQLSWIVRTYNVLS